MSTPTNPDPKLLTLDNLLNVLGTADTVLISGVAGPEVAAGADIAGYLLNLAKASIAAYEAQTGKPIDPTLLHREEPIP